MIRHDEFSDTNSISPYHAENQDSILTDDDHMVYAVADGVGGYAGGKIASSYAVELLSEKMKTISEESELRSCIQEIHDAVRVRASELGYPLMGTTIAACKVFESSKTILCANVGDSPIFLIRGGRASPLYYDDSQRYEDPSNTWSLTQYLGFAPGKLAIHTRKNDCLKGDILLLCSDGVSDNLLTGSADLGTIANIVQTNSARKIVNAAIERALKPDDMSAILLFL